MNMQLNSVTVNNILYIKANKTKARENEYVVVVANINNHNFEIGEIVKKIEDGYFKPLDKDYKSHMLPSEYVVLKNYNPMPISMSGIHIGDKVIVNDIGQCYPLYSEFLKIHCPEYIKNFVDRSNPETNRLYSVVSIGVHELNSEFLYVIQNPKTKQVFIMGKKGVEKINE